MNNAQENEILITEEKPEDIQDIRSVLIDAFEGPGEADVVDQLRQACPTFLSLVAKIDKKVVGYILFTPAQLVPNEGWTIEGLGLAPLAVLPDYQNQGIGIALCVAGLTRAALAGYPFVAVLGHPAYYPRFGFKPASTYGIKSSFQDVPDDAFMIKILNPKIMTDAQGVVYYRQEFNSVT